MHQTWSPAVTKDTAVFCTKGCTASHCRYLSTGAGVTLVNAHYMRSLFGVTGAQSAASGYAVYTPGSGARDLRVNLALTYSINQKTSVTAAVSASSLVGDAKASPLTQKRTSESGVVAVRYAF